MEVKEGAEGGPGEPQGTEKRKDLHPPEKSQNYTSKQWKTINSCPANQRRATSGQRAVGDSLHGQSAVMANPDQ